MKKLTVLALIVMISAFSFSQSINVTFQVDMSYQTFQGNFPAGANVVVRGDFQANAGDSNGNWQGNLFQLTDADDDSIYIGTFQIPANYTGNTYSFKYVITNPPANDNWETDPNREFTLTSPATILPVVWFNNDSFYVDLVITNTLKFTADISSILGVGIDGAFDPTQDSLLVMGLDGDQSGYVIGNRRMHNTETNLGIFKTTLIGNFVIGRDSTRWKFKAYPESRFQNSGWEFGEDRWYIYEANGSTVTLPTIVPRILPKFFWDFNLFTLNLDMSGAINRYNGLPIPLNEIEFVGVKGTRTFLGNMLEGCWCADDTSSGEMVLLSQVSDNTWKLEKEIPIGTNTGIVDYKFVVMYPGADTINGGISPLDNEFTGGLFHSFVLIDTPYTVLNVKFGSLIPEGVERIENSIPSNFLLEQNYPNPFNPTTVIRYSIPEMGYVTLKVFNILGQEIDVLVNSEQPAGIYEATFDANNLSSGIYFYSLQTKNFISTKKMILLR